MLNFNFRLRRLLFYLINRLTYTEKIFYKKYFDKNLSWHHPKISESLSGDGSGSKQTVVIRKKIPLIIQKYNIKSIFDAACGDFYWMKFIINNKIQYIGADLIICRDVLTHLPLDIGMKAKDKFIKSKSKFLLSTTYTNTKKNINIPKGDFRPINLTKEPYLFGKPLLLINEKCSEKNYKYKDKCIGLWKLN